MSRVLQARTDTTQLLFSYGTNKEKEQMRFVLFLAWSTLLISQLLVDCFGGCIFVRCISVDYIVINTVLIK